MRIVLLSILFPIICNAQISTRQVQQLNDLLNGFSGRNPGIAVTIVSDTGTIYEYYAGFENLGNNRLITEESEFNLASLTKQTVALSYLKLFGLKAIDTLQLKHVTSKYPHFSEIKISDLLNHCSGIREFHTIRQLKGINNSKVIKQAEIESYLQDWTRLSYPSGQQHSYSNSNYYILSEALNDYLSNKSPTDFMLFRMNSGLDQMHYDQKHCQRPAYGHTGALNFEMFKAKETITGYSNLFCSNANYQKWLSYILNSDEILQAIKQPYYLRDTRKLRVPYQLGFIQSTYNRDSVFEHGGNAQGYQSFMRVIPSKKMAISVLINSDVFGADYYVNKIHEIINGKPIAQFTQFVGRVVCDKGQAIPYAEIYADEESGPGLANDTGFFFYQSTAVLEGITVNHAAYEKRTINIDHFDKPKQISLSLKPKVNHKPNAELRQDPLSQFTPEIVYSMAPWVSSPGAVIVNQFGEIGQVSRLDTLSAFITKEALEQTPFRFVVYKTNLETGWPDQYPIYMSDQLQANKGNEWVSCDVSEAGIQVNGQYFVGIQWLRANGVSGAKAQYLGFDAHKNTHISYYRSPFDIWRRVGELMLRGNRDMMIDVSSKIASSSQDIQSNNLKTFYLKDTLYDTYYPAVLDHGQLFIEAYPHSRELRFESDGVNTWKGEAQDWIFRAEFDDKGAYVFKDHLPGRIAQSYQVIEYGSCDACLPWLAQSNKESKIKTISTEDGSLKWKIKLKGSRMRIKLKCGQYMWLDHFHDDVYILEGDVSFGRTVKLIKDSYDTITAIQYSDSRNFKIMFNVN